MIYEFFGETINVSQSLREYVEIQRDFKRQVDEDIAAFEENARFYSSPLNQLGLIQSRISIFIDGIIRKLNIVNDFSNCTQQDFLQHNSYAELMTVTKKYDAYCELLKSRKDVKISTESIEAAIVANSKITGLGWGLISSSIADHLLYQIQNQQAIQRQTEEAKQYYNEALDRIQGQAEQQATLESRNYYKRIYIPQMKAAIHNAYSGILLCYLKILDNIGAIDIEEISTYDYDRSQQVLKNIHNGSDYVRTITTALALCPYNINVYLEAYKLNVYKLKVTTIGLSLEHIASDIGIWGDIYDITNPVSLSDEEAIENEIDRFLENEIDPYEDNWKQRATTYHREAQQLIEKYPNSFAGYGLTASFLIAKNYKTEYSGFWDEFKENIAKFFACYTGLEGYKHHFHWILILIKSSIGTYFKESYEYLKHNLPDDSEFSRWIFVASAKWKLIPAIGGVQFLIQCLEDAEKSSQLGKMLKNDLLWYVCVFCGPYVISKSYDNSVVIRYHIPLMERKFAIDLYDELIAQGVNNYTDGKYAYEKKYKSYEYKLYGSNIWRDEISQTGQNYLNSLSGKNTSSQGCYIATCVYGSYDCPPVWTLRRYRDSILKKTWYGKLFIRTYYTISPKLVKLFGDSKLFNILWKKILDKIINNLQLRGYSNTPYYDK